MSTAEVDRPWATRSAGDETPTPIRTRWSTTRWSTTRWSTLTWRRVAEVLAPGLLYLGVRQVGLIVLGWMADHNRVPVSNALTSWDGQWYLGIATHGYDAVPDNLTDAFGRRAANTPLAFFPGYPLSVHWVSRLPGVGLTAAAFAVSLVAGLVCAYGISRIGAKVSNGSRRVSLILVTLFAASPMAIVLSMTYSEALFCALTAWALVGVLERKWLLAGLCTAAAGLVRPTAAALIITVVVVAAIAVVRRQDGWRPWVGALLAPVGLLGYLGFVGHRIGQWDGWFALQRDGWNSAFDGGMATLQFTRQALASGRSVLEVGTVGVILAAIVLIVISLRTRVDWPLIAFGTLVLAMDVCSNGLMNSKARLLLPAFTLLIPVACALAGRKRATMIASLVAVVLVSAWFGAYSITVWQYAI